MDIPVNQKEETVKNLAMVHSVLADGMYPGRLCTKLFQARSFIEAIHASALQDLESDPEYKKETDGPTPKEP